MVDFLRHLLLVPGLHDWGLHPRETKNQERSSSSPISSSTSPSPPSSQTSANETQWLLNRSQRARYDPHYQNPSVYYNTYPDGGQYGMHPMPPPMYDPNAAPPPTYQPPAGGTKVDPSQWRGEPTRRPTAGEPSPAYQAPPGPPPAHGQTETGAGSSNPYRL